MLNSYWELVKNEGRFWLDGHVRFQEQSSVDTPPTNNIELYAKDKSGVAALYCKNDAGTEAELAGLAVTGIANRLAYFSSTSAISPLSALTSTRVLFADSNGLPTDSANFTRDATGGFITIKNSASGAALKLDSSNSAHNTAIHLGVNGSNLWQLSIEASSSKLQVFNVAGSLSALQFDNNRNTLVGTGAISTSATAPFFNLNSCAGTPTGNPSPASGQVPLIYDTSNNKLYGYNSSWRDLTGNALTGSGTDTQIAYWTGTGALSSSANLIFDRTNVRLGLRVTPSFEFHGQAADGSSFNNTLDCYGTGVTANYRGRAARGTASSFSALQADDNILALSALPGVNTNTFASGARANIIMKAGENLTTSNQGTYITFSTTPTGGSTTLTERFRFGALGQLGIGGATFGTSGNPLVSGGSSAAPSWASAFAFDTANSRLGVNHTAPDVTLHAREAGTGGTRGLVMEQYGAFTGGASFFGKKSRNATPGSHTALSANDVICVFAAAGSDGSSFGSGAAFLRCVAAENFTSTNQGNNVEMLTVNTGGTGTTVRLLASANGNIVAGAQSALATNATDGFLYIPTCAGTPTGTPTSYTGKVPMTYDTSNNKLYIYNSGWKTTSVFA